MANRGNKKKPKAPKKTVTPGNPAVSVKTPVKTPATKNK
jgi:hypothetical protein